MKSDKKVYSRTIPAGTKAARYPDKDDAKHQRLIQKSDDRKKFISIADQVAQSTIFTRNWKWPGADQHYPLEADLRMVSKYYPYAQGGPLLVDDAYDQKEAAELFLKQKILRKLGFRHVVIESDSSLFDVLEQLGEI